MKNVRAITGGLVLVAACAALMPASMARADTRAGGAAARPASTHGCASGTVCMYTDSGWDSGDSEHHWWVYGCSNLSGEYGDRYVFNNQYGGATVTLYKGSNCAGEVVATIPAGQLWQGDITPVNSLALNS